MEPHTRRQLLALNQAFYEAHADAFDRSRGARPWPGWPRLLPWLPAASPGTPGRRPLGPVLDVGCGNARFACFLDAEGFAFAYTGVDANAALLEAARRQLPAGVARTATLVQQDFLASGRPGEDLPAGPFALGVLMGVLHHVPGADWRLALLRAVARRIAPGGLLALAAWQFEDDPRERRKQVEPAAVGAVLGAPLDPATLEPGDALLRFGDDPAAPPRYCHSIRDAEFETWPAALGLSLLEDFRADGARGVSNRYAVLRRA